MEHADLQEIAVNAPGLLELAEADEQAGEKGLDAGASLVGSSTAFISIGISCQSTFQLASNSHLVSELVGEPLTYKSSFFNWVMVSADSVVRILERLVGSPIRPSSIRVPPEYMRCCTLDGHKAWFWHEKPGHEMRPELQLDMASKYEHLRRNFLDLCSRPTRHFILCNTQNNIATQDPHLRESMTLVFDDKLIAAARSTLDRLFPVGTNRLLMVSRSDRLAPAMRKPVYLPPSDDTEWQGHTGSWVAILASCLGGHRPT